MMLGSTFSTAVEHTPHDREVVGMNSDGTWAILSSLSHQKCVLNQVPHGDASVVIFL